MTKQFFFIENFYFMRITCIIFFSLFFSSLTFAQTKISELSQNKHLEQLKNGILFVQLPRIEQKKIDILEKSESQKNKDLAKKVKEENILLQKKVRDGFSNNYNFSEIYFFEAKNTKQILNGDFSNNLTDKEGNSIQLNNDSTKEKYLAYYGIANVAGENSRYNGDGILIQYIHNGKLERLKSDIFFETTSRFFGIIRGNKSISQVISDLNEKFRKKYSPTY